MWIFINNGQVQCLEQYIHLITVCTWQFYLWLIFYIWVLLIVMATYMTSKEEWYNITNFRKDIKVMNCILKQDLFIHMLLIKSEYLRKWRVFKEHICSCNLILNMTLTILYRFLTWQCVIPLSFMKIYCFVTNLRPVILTSNKLTDKTIPCATWVTHYHFLIVHV